MLLPDVHMREQSESLRRALDHGAYGLWEATRTLVLRDDSSSSSSSHSTCKPGNDSNKCVTPASVQNSQNLAIILGVVIPLSCAVIVLIFLHRRLRRKQKHEDIHDPHKSLDFGMEGLESVKSKTSKNSGAQGPEMSVAHGNGRPSRRGQGLSMDMGMGIASPYMLPPGLQGSHESIHSMSRMRDEHDPYRPVTFLRPSTDDGSVHRFGRLNDDKGSIYSATTSHYSAMPDRDRAGLLANARPMSQSFGKRTDSFKTDATSPQETTSPSDLPLRQMHSARQNSLPPRKASLDKALPEINEKDGLTSPLLVMPAPAAKELPPPPPRTTSSTTATSSMPPRGDSMLTTSATSMPSRPESSNYGDDEPATLSHPTVTIHEPVDSQYDVDPSMIYARYSDEVVAPSPEPDLMAPKPLANQRLSVIGMRPLPKELPDDTPEVRANRIRSFYKEYFDDSKPNPASMYMAAPPQGGYYEDDYYGGVLDGVIYDPDNGGFFVPGSKPWAQGPARRAMTPPPRSRPRVSGNSTGNFHDRHASTMSAGRPRGRSVPKKKLPPPAPLHSLPTPHKLKEDDLVYTPIDFAPPSSFREFQNGRRPDSPMGVQRPYSPSVRAFTPLASSFENLAVLPSPHDLRKSGTFTALDFAPPSKIRDPMLSPNDAGSVRSGRSARSGISAVQSNAVRDGAYRVSRIPKEMVTTRDDLATQLRPKMDMTTPA